MTADIVPATEIARRRVEREKQRRREREPYAGSILDALDHVDDQPCMPASMARTKETQR